MKKVIQLIFFCLFVLKVSAQDSLVLYYTNGYDRTADSAASTFVRKAIFKDSLWHVNEYYKGVVLLESCSYYVLDSVREGHFIEYHSNGRKRAEGNYMQNVQIGKWTTWYENGNLNSEQVFLEDIGAITKLIKGDKRIAASFLWARSSKRGYNGISTGVNNWYYESGVKSAEEIYKNGRITKARFWDEQGVEMKVKIKDYYSNERAPEFNEDIDLFFRQNMNHPTSVSSGRLIYISLNVSKDGKVDDVSVFRSSGDKTIDNEVLRVAKLMSGKFSPSISHNRKRDTKLTFPVRL